MLRQGPLQDAVGPIKSHFTPLILPQVRFWERTFNFHSLKNIDFPVGVKGIYHYWICFFRFVQCCKRFDQVPLSCWFGLVVWRFESLVLAEGKPGASTQPG